MSSGVIVLDGNITIQDADGNTIGVVKEGNTISLSVANLEQNDMLSCILKQLIILNKHLANITEMNIEAHEVEDCL